MDLHWFTIIGALLCTGLVSGVLAGLLGIGGGIVVVPVLSLVFQLIGVSPSTSVSVATGTSLLVIIATSTSSVRSHYKVGNVDTALLRFLAPYIILGAIAGAFLSSVAGGLFASAVFGVVAILAALNMSIRAHASPILKGLPSRYIQVLFGWLNGAVSVVMGVGGGTLGVPLLTACNVAVHRAIGTSAAFGFLVALPGVLFSLLFIGTPVDAPMATVGFVNFLGALLIVPVSVITAPLGAKIASTLSSVVLKYIFSAFLVCSGTRMLYQAISGF